MRKVIVSLTAAAVLALSALAPAHADESRSGSLQARIDAILAEHPGGVQTSQNTISWEDGTIVLTLAGGGLTPFAVGSCSTGYFCAYNSVSLTGSKLSFSVCNATHSTASLPGVVRSIANARSTGYVQGQNSGGTPLVTVYAGGQSNSTPSGITQLACVS